MRPPASLTRDTFFPGLRRDTYPHRSPKRRDDMRPGFRGDSSWKLTVETGDRYVSLRYISVERCPSRRGEGKAMKVWIDQDLCTGDGLCEEIAPAVFTLLDDGLSYVKEGDKIFDNPGGAEGLAVVPDGMDDAVTGVRRGVPRGVHLHRGIARRAGRR